MPLIEVTVEEDASLEGVVPKYLKGPKATTRRVQWAISEVVDWKRSNEDGNGKDSG